MADLARITAIGEPEAKALGFDLVRVKGKHEPVAIFEPLGPSEELAEDVQRDLEDYVNALAAYRRQDFEFGMSLFKKLRERSDALLYNIYLDRIERFRREPPPSGWDRSRADSGVHRTVCRRCTNRRRVPDSPWRGPS